MKFTHTPPDLIIHAETGQEIAELCKHFNMPIEKHVDDLIKGSLTYVSSGAKRPWLALLAGYDAAASVPFTFLQPYYDRLKDITGYDGPAFIVSDWRLLYCSNNGKKLSYTHIVTGASIDENGYHADGFQQAGDWDKTAAQLAPRYFNGYLRAHLGFTKSEPEYLRVGSTAMLRRNPDYLKRSAAEPHATSEAVFEVIFGHWLAAVATPAQVKIYDAAQACYATVVKSSSLAAGLMKTVGEFHVNNYSRTVTFDQFKEMGNV